MILWAPKRPFFFKLFHEKEVYSNLFLIENKAKENHLQKLWLLKTVWFCQELERWQLWSD